MPATRWDEQIDRDAAAGSLDFLFSEAEDESKQIPGPALAPIEVTSVATRRFWTLFHGCPLWIGTHAEYNRLVGS